MEQGQREKQEPEEAPERWSAQQSIQDGHCGRARKLTAAEFPGML